MSRKRRLTEDDYAEMGADCFCARADHPAGAQRTVEADGRDGYTV